MCDDCDQPPLPTGSASASSEPEAKSDHPLAVLWVPDVEARRGWREFHVRRQEESKPGRRVGFRHDS